MKSYGVRKTLAILLSVVLALPLFVFATFADDPVFTQLPVYSDSVESGQTWYNRSQLKSDTANENYDSATIYLSEDGNTLKIVYTANAETVTELHTRAQEPAYFAYLCVLPEFGDPLPTSPDGLSDGDYWFDKDGLAAVEQEAELATASYYLSNDGSMIRIVSESFKVDVANDNEDLGELVFGFLHQVGEDETKAYLTINVPDEPVCNGDTVQVTVDLEQNPGLVGMLLSLNYDPAVLTLTNVQGAGMMTAGNFTPGNDLSARPYNILWDDGTVHANHTETGTILTLTFTVKDTAAAGSTAITLTYAADSTFNVDLQDVALHISDAALSIVRHTPGDADGDGEVDVMDITVLSRYLAEGWDVTVDARNSDVNGDGELDLRDVVLIRRFLAGGWGVELV